MPEFRPPQASDFEPTLSARLEPTRTRSDSEPKEPLPPPPPPQSAEEADDELEESKVSSLGVLLDCCYGDVLLPQVPTWILHEEQLANAAATKPCPPPSLDVSSPLEPSLTKPPRPKNFAVTPDLPTPKLLHATPPSPGSVAVPLSPTQTPLQSPLAMVAAGNTAKKQITAEPVRLPAPRNLKSATSTSSLSSRPVLPGKGGQKFSPLNMKKSRSQAELGRRGAGKPPSLSKHSSLTQVKSQLARVSVSSKDSLKPGSVESMDSSVSSSGSSNSPLIHHRRMSLGSLPLQAPPSQGKAPHNRGGDIGGGAAPPLPKLAVRELHKTASKPAADHSNNTATTMEATESAEVPLKKSERELELEGEIERLKGDLAKVNTFLIIHTTSIIIIHFLGVATRHADRKP